MTSSPRITDSDAFSANAEQQLVELIRQNSNHPSILIWGLYNEITLEDGPDPTALMVHLASVAKSEDPSRPTQLPTVVVVALRARHDPRNEATGDTLGGR